MIDAGRAAALIALAAACSPPGTTRAAALRSPPEPAAPPARVELGIDVLLADQAHLLEKKRLGLITNPAGVDSDLVPTADRLARDPRFDLVQLYAPEHGLRGDVPAGEPVASDVDPLTGLPVESLYGGRRRPTPESLARIDVLLFDLQDVGSRTYTYLATLGEAMTAAAEARVPVVVLDRPNPLGGELFEGPVIRPEHKSFIGWGPLPVSHGLTAGEMARFYEQELDLRCELSVVRMRGWRRAMIWEDTGLDWVQTSPHMPQARTAHLYIATGMVAGLLENVNDGIGTTLPFELLAAEFVDAEALRALLAAERLPGLRLRAIHITPRYGKLTGTLLHGVQLLPSDLRAFRPVRTALTCLWALQRLYPDELRWQEDAVLARHWGQLEMFAALRAGARPEAIEAAWAQELAGFAERRAGVLLYE
jgi:uncharacterized protein YbbC (DUF1343 family)